MQAAIRHVAAGAAVILMALGAMQQPADAHASVLSTFPSDGAELDTTPPSIEIAFNESVIVPEGSVRLISSGGREETLRHVSREEVSGTLTEAPVPTLPDGWYAISWRAISADGHPVSGTFTFRVGAAGQSLADASLIVSDPARPYLRASHPLRALNYTATLLALGLLGAAWASSGPRARTENPQLGDRLRRLSMAAAVTGIVTIALAVVNSALILNGGSTDRLGTVIQLILRSAAGSGHMIRLSGMLALCTAVLLLIDQQTRKVGWVVAVVGGYAILHAYAVAGHASLVPQEVLARVSLIAHLGAGAAWLGGIPGVLLAITARPRPGRAVIAELVDRYSRIATVSVVIVLVFGTATAFTMVENVTDLFTTAYGISMLAKILIVLILAAIGAYNHYSVVPALRARAAEDELREGPGHAEEAAQRHDEPERSLRATLAAESAGLVAVIVATAFLTATGAPAAGWSDGIAHLGHRHGAGAGGISPRLGDVLDSLEPQIVYVAVGSGEARVSFAPGSVGRENLLRIEISGRDGEPQDVEMAFVTFSHPATGIEGLERYLERRAEGDLRLRTYDLGVAGEWTVEAYLRFPDGRVEIFEFLVTMRAPA